MNRRGFFGGWGALAAFLGMSEVPKEQPKTEFKEYRTEEYTVELTVYTTSLDHTYLPSDAFTEKRKRWIRERWDGTVEVYVTDCQTWIPKSILKEDV